MAVLKYRDENGNFVPASVVVIEGEGNENNGSSNTGGSNDGNTQFTVKIPNMYYDCVNKGPISWMEINTTGMKSLSFEYHVDPFSNSSTSRSRVSITAYMGSHAIEKTNTSPRYLISDEQDRVYILSSVKNVVEGTFVLDVEAYNSIVIAISSNIADTNVYKNEAGGVEIRNFMPM